VDVYRFDTNLWNLITDSDVRVCIGWDEQNGWSGFFGRESRHTPVIYDQDIESPEAERMARRFGLEIELEE
jgi:hypothetical protein